MTTQIYADRDRGGAQGGGRACGYQLAASAGAARTTPARPSGAGIFLADQGARRRGPQVRSGYAEVFGGLHGLA